MNFKAETWAWNAVTLAFLSKAINLSPKWLTETMHLIKPEEWSQRSIAVTVFV